MLLHTADTDAKNQTPVGSTNPLPVTPVGGAASGAADDASAPIKTGGVFRSTPITLADGQRGETQVNAKGYTRIEVGDATGAVANVSTQVDGGSNSVTGLVIRSYGVNLNVGGTWDRVRGDVNGQVSQPYAVASSRWTFAGASGGIVNTTTAVTIIAAAGASVRNYLTNLNIAHDALGAATEIAVRDGAAGTVLWRGKLQTTANEGFNVQFPTPLKGTANTLMEVVTLTAVTGGVFVNAQGFQGT